MITIEQKAFDVFMKKFKAGDYGQQRLGQAFYNEFKLHKLSDQTQLLNVYEKDGQPAVACIRQFVTFN